MSATIDRGTASGTRGSLLGAAGSQLGAAGSLSAATRSLSLEGSAPGQRSRGAAPPTGPVLFARYAFGPNRLGLCGPEDWRGLLELGIAGVSDRGTEVDRALRELAAGFEGAYPYLELIAGAHGIGDALDPRVVEAYWLGNALSDGVAPGLMARSIDQRFRGQVAADAWAWLAGKPALGARPTHAFHVLEVFSRLGPARGNQVTDVVALMDSCRIRWGRVVDVRGDQLLVAVVPLGLAGGRLALEPERPVLVRRWLAGSGFVAEVEIGDTVSVHWDWACEVLDAQRLGALRLRTLRAIEIANQTI